MFNVASVTAGICEEIVFRGFLIAYLMAQLGVLLGRRSWRTR